MTLRASIHRLLPIAICWWLATGPGCENERGETGSDIGGDQPPGDMELDPDEVLDREELFDGGETADPCPDAGLHDGQSDRPSDCTAILPPDAVVDLIAPGTIGPRDQLPLWIRIRRGAEEPTVDDRMSLTVQLATSSGVQISPDRILVRRGMGSVTLSVAAEGDFHLGVEGMVQDRWRVVRVRPPVMRRLSGTLEGSALVWGPDETVLIEAETTVPREAVLTIHPGTTVRLAERVNLVVQGEIASLGTWQSPILFLPDRGDHPWGGVVHQGFGDYSYTLFIGGGGDPDRVFGHSSSQPVLFAQAGGTLRLDACAIQDGPGKALGADRASVTLSDSLITRMDTGGELEFSRFDIQRTFFLDFPTIGAEPADDDNDGIYLLGTVMNGDTPHYSRILDSVFISGLDDGIDHNGATLEIRRCWIEGFAHEGVAGSSSGHVQVVDTVITGCEQGLEAGYGAPLVSADHVLLSGNDVGARYGDSYGWDVLGRLEIENSIVAGNRRHAVWNHVNNLEGPSPTGVMVTYTLLDQVGYDTGEGNLLGEPIFREDLLLEEGSPGKEAASDGLDMGLLTGRSP